ncbi:hypothetical protein SCHPADRAFT_700822 [Schizopora paradoxa]|uniref:Uncharacterized protein n=1 Tax=Schizopora paradoxa TaxID=27342 RepID=A0A0H2RMP5_9AGAM|nr:hypothetical protein SCHPADRAFT_700822 [Schizopora paradoxa]
MLETNSTPTRNISTPCYVKAVSVARPSTIHAQTRDSTQIATSDWVHLREDRAYIDRAMGATSVRPRVLFP